MGRKISKIKIKIHKSKEMPNELKKALSKDKKARDIFNKFPPSKKKMFYKWIIQAQLHPVASAFCEC